MKIPKTNIALGAACAAIMMLVLHNQRAVSQPVPPTAPPAFTAHYSEVSTDLAGGATSATFTLPVVNRAIRMSVSFVRDDGDYTFQDMMCLYATTRGEFNVKGAGPINNPDAWPDGLGLGGVTLFGGTNGTFYFRHDGGPNASLHVALWY